MGAEDFRRNIIDHLRLIASPEEQLEYERQLIEHGCGWVPWELFEGWFDFYHPGFGMFEDAFSPEEQAALAEFNEVIDSAAGKVPDDSVEAMLKSQEWQQVMKAANQWLQLTGDARDG
jgi:hypothetical protein